MKREPLLVMSRYSVADVSIRVLRRASIFFLRLAKLDSLHYFWRPTGKLAGTKRELPRNALLAPRLSE